MVNLIWFLAGVMTAALLLWLFAIMYNIGVREGKKQVQKDEEPKVTLYRDEKKEE